MTNPTLRFKSADGLDFPDTVSCTLADISKYAKGTIERKNCLFIGNEQLISNLGGATLEFRTEAKGTEFNSGDILFGNIRPYLKKVWLSDQSGVASPDVLTFKVTNSIPGYLKCILSSERFFNHVAQGYKGSKMPRGDKHQIMNFRIQYPCLEEQQKIASFFSTLDQKIELNELKIEALERLKKGLLKKIFSQELRFRDKNGRDFPLWNEVVLSSISGKITVGIANSATHAYTKRGIALIRNTNIKPNYLDETDIAHITQDFAKKYESKKLKVDDILICRTDYPGTACLVPKKYEGAQTFTTLIVRIDKSYALPAYVCQYINSDRGKEYLNKTSIGGGQKNSGAGIIKDLLIPIPCIDEQYAILEILQSLDNKISIITTKLDSIKRLKQGFMQQMFI